MMVLLQKAVFRVAIDGLLRCNLRSFAKWLVVAMDMLGRASPFALRQKVFLSAFGHYAESVNIRFT